MKISEQAIVFPCAGEQLLGIVSSPEQAEKTGVLIVVGGPQYRAGSHRQFILLARALAAAGFPAMRFDYRGMGDSSGDLRVFEEVNEDIGVAISAFKRHSPKVKNVVLWGLCDAASACLLYCGAATNNPQVTGLVLLNPWVRSEVSLAKTHIKHYYGQRLLQVEFWRKLISGQLGLRRAIGSFVGSLKRALAKQATTETPRKLPFHHRMRCGLEEFSGDVLLILSSNDYTAKEFLDAATSDQKWAAALGKASVKRVDIPNADHTFSSAEWRKNVESIVCEWLAAKQFGDTSVDVASPLQNRINGEWL